MIQFNMNKIIVDQFAILSNNVPEQGSDIQLNSQLGFKVDHENKLIASTMRFDFVGNNETFLVLEVTCIFTIEPNCWEQLTDDKVLHLPKDFLAHMGMHTIGTSRGILHCKTENTPFNVFLLPPIDVIQMIPEDLYIPIENK